jgi:hypothetical protein
MISWIARGLLIAAGFVASWFVTSDVPRFGLVQAAVVLVLLVSIVAVLAFRPAKWSIRINRIEKKLNIRWQQAPVRQSREGRS